MVYPLPEKTIRDFAAAVKKLIVVEELDPFIEEQISAMGIDVQGKGRIPIYGELNLDIVGDAFADAGGAGTQPEFELPKLPPRPPNMCPGCPHRGVFYTLSKKKIFVAGDIGCYTLAFLPPLRAIDTCLCMGASIGQAVGMGKVLGESGQGKVAAVIGDSTFFHSGITPLIDASYNKSSATIIILNNKTTAMTGAQNHPGTGKTLRGEETHAVDIAGLARALGVKRVRKVDPYRIEETRAAIEEELASPETSVVISESPCVLLPGSKRDDWYILTVDSEVCNGCKACLMLGCPALGWEPNETNAKGKKGRSSIDPQLCIGCGMCKSLCKFNAIVRRPGD
jgi:indolepyruvate ferredoxin oxidoreductase alpha subunit